MVLDPDCHLSYVLLANVYKTVGRWKEAMEIIKMMRDRCVKKTAGPTPILSGSVTLTLC